MRIFKVDMSTSAFATVTVKLTDEDLAVVANDLNIDVDKLTIDDLLDVISDKAYENGPGGLCVHCAGMRSGSTYVLDLGEEWDIEDNTEREPEYRGIREQKN